MTTDTTPASDANASTAKNGIRVALVPAFLLAIIWLITLAVLSLWTANPATLNRTQILHSQVLLTGRIVDPLQGKIEVLEVQQIRAAKIDDLVAGKTVLISPVSKNWKTASQRIFPLFRSKAGNWEITPAPISKDHQIDYPATDLIKKEIAELLSSDRQ